MSEREHRHEDPDGDDRPRANRIVARPETERSERRGPASDILTLQQLAGNDAVTTLLAVGPTAVQRAPAEAPAPARAPVSHPELSAGMEGPAVLELQDKLNHSVDEARLASSGRFDAHTDEVVKRFQVQSRLRPDGIVGPNTWAALDAMFGGTKAAGDELTKVAELTFEARTLFDAGDVQGALAKRMAVYADPLTAHKAARGGIVYDIATCHHRLSNFQEAISFYQEAMGTPGLGAAEAGSAAENLRRARLKQPYQSFSEMEAERAAFQGRPVTDPHSQLSIGATDPEVSELQEKLNHSVGEANLKVTGRFDSHTDEVVKRFQVQSGLRPDGIVGPDTWAALDSVFGGAEATSEEMSRLGAVVGEGLAAQAAGDFGGALSKFMSVYGDPMTAHKSARGGLVYGIAECHHRLGNFDEAISFYQEVMKLPGVGAQQAGSAAENLRRARLKQPFQSDKDMEAERAAFSGRPVTDPHPQLSAGSTDPAVSELQEKLNRAVAEANLEVNGRFDGHTDEVVKRFQTQSGLRPDGIVGPDTWGALDSVFGGAEAAGDQLSKLAQLTMEAETLFEAGDVQGALDKRMAVYADPLMAHKAARAGVVYDIAACHHKLGNFEQAISFYEEAMALPKAGAGTAGSAAENLRRARLKQPYQTTEEMTAEAAAYNP